MSVRVNIGCGRTPTPGWTNYDNSLSVRLARAPALVLSALTRARLLDQAQVAFIEEARRKGVRHMDATRRLPFDDGAVDVIYTSHMLEHLGDSNARRFLRETHRVLAPGGILRVAVPDIARLVDDYRTHRDADLFMERTYLGRDPASTWTSRLRALAIGDRGHHWMYDGPSLVRRLLEVGFKSAAPTASGSTSIPTPAGLDLCERADESVYVEAHK